VLAGWLCACAVHHNEELLVKPGQRLVLRWKKRLAAALLVVVLCGGGPLGLRVRVRVRVLVSYRTGRPGCERVRAL
jgi:hypothetical protein